MKEDICNKFVTEVKHMHRYLPHYTYEDYCEWEGRWELIDGIPVAMSLAPRELHQIVAGNLFVYFRQSVKDACGSCRALLPIDWVVKEDTVLQPDVLIICGPLLEKAYLSFTPELVAEVLSPSTAIKDRNAKFKIYEENKVKYYLILDVKIKRMEVYELVNDKYRLVAENPPTFTFTLHNNCSFTVPFNELWD